MLLPRIGNRRVDAITPADLLAVLQPIWAPLDEARRIRQRIGLVMRWAVARGYRADNPAGDILAAALPQVNRKATPRLALPHGEVAASHNLWSKFSRVNKSVGYLCVPV